MKTSIGVWPVVGEFYRDADVVVLKVVHKDAPELVRALKLCLNTRPGTVAAFRREIKVMWSQPLLGDMPAMLGEGEDKWGRPYFVMTASSDVKDCRKSEKLAVAVARFLIACAIKLRKKGLLHRDLKLENVGIEVDEQGNAHFVLRDWSTLRTMSAANIWPSVAGTPGYRTEETICLGITDECTECHAIGCTFLHLLPKGCWLHYWKALLLSISPFRQFRVRTFEELDDLICHSRVRFFRLVKRLAGVWKTAIVVKWLMIAVITLIAAAIVIMEIVEARYEKLLWQRFNDKIKGHGSGCVSLGGALVGEVELSVLLV